MGSLAEPCTDDMEPFIKTCRALCMVLWPKTDMPVSGSAKPAVRKEHFGISAGGEKEKITATFEHMLLVYTKRLHYLTDQIA